MARGAIAYKGQLYLGGSKVEANPTGSAEGGNLSKLGVDDTVYAIPQVNNGILTIQKNGTNVATFSANQSENVTANIDVSEDIAGTKTISGNPITLTDVAPINAESLVVELEPKQDLHGQDAPYVGGAGKNKLPLTVDGLKSANTDGTWTGNAYTLYGVTFTINTDADGNVTSLKVNGTASATIFFKLCDFPSCLTDGISYKINGNASDYDPNTAYMQVQTSNGGGVANVGSEYTLAYTSGGTAQRLIIRIDENGNPSNLVLYPMIRLATETDPTFAPYSNICPITGYTECEVESADSATDPTITNSATIQFGQTVYGGRSNFTDGGTDVTYGFITIDETASIEEQTSGDNKRFCITAAVTDVDEYSTDHICEMLEIAAGNNATQCYTEDNKFAVYAAGYIFISHIAEDVTALRALLAETPLKVAYVLNTASTISTPPTDLKLLQGTNNLTTNGTTITLGYQPDNSIGDAVKASEEYTDRRMDALGDLAYINEDGDNSTKFLRGDGTWQNTPTGATTLADLTDTAILSPSNGQVLKYNGSKWVNSANYSLPKASAGTLGGVKVGANLSIDSDGVLSATGGGGGETPTIVDSDDVYISADQAYIRFRKYSNGMKSIHIYSLGFSAGTHSGIVPNKYMPIGMDRTMSEGYRYLNLTGHSPADYSIRSLIIEFVGDTIDGNLIMTGTSQGIAVDAFYI